MLLLLLGPRRAPGTVAPVAPTPALLAPPLFACGYGESEALRLAAADRVGWLLHLDPDELLHPGERACSVLDAKHWGQQARPHAAYLMLASAPSLSPRRRRPRAEPAGGAGAAAAARAGRALHESGGAARGCRPHQPL